MKIDVQHVLAKRLVQTTRGRCPVNNESYHWFREMYCKKNDIEQCCDCWVRWARCKVKRMKNEELLNAIFKGDA